jgi:hypothetical protein
MTELLHISRVVIQHLNNTPLVDGSAMVVWVIGHQGLQTSPL